MKEKEEKLKETFEIIGEKYNSDVFKQKFLEKNSKYLTENIRIVFTPRTLKLKREKILATFSQIYGPLLSSPSSSSSTSSIHDSFIVDDNREKKPKLKNSKNFERIWKYW